MGASGPEFEREVLNLQQSLEKGRLELKRQQQRIDILSQVLKTQEGMLRQMHEAPAVAMFPYRTASQRLLSARAELKKVNDACDVLRKTISDGETSLRVAEAKAAEVTCQVLPFRGPHERA